MVTPEQIALDTVGTSRTIEEVEQVASENDCTAKMVIEAGGVEKCPGCGYWVFSETVLAGYCETCMEEEYDDEF